MKRKDVGEASDEFFDFTLSSPALKIRRLDAELAPIDEEVMINPLLIGQSMESINNMPENEERAIVVFNPNNNLQSTQSPPSISVSANSHFHSRFKNPVIWSKNQSNAPNSLVDATNKECGCLAVVGWAPSHNQHPPTADAEDRGPQMDADADVMDIEDDYNIQQMMKPEQDHVKSVNQGFHQWQQHCQIQQANNNLSTSITWFGRCA